MLHIAVLDVLCYAETHFFVLCYSVSDVCCVVSVVWYGLMMDCVVLCWYYLVVLQNAMLCLLLYYLYSIVLIESFHCSAFRSLVLYNTRSSHI